MRVQRSELEIDDNERRLGAVVVSFRFYFVHRVELFETSTNFFAVDVSGLKLLQSATRDILSTLK